MKLLLFFLFSALGLSARERILVKHKHGATTASINGFHAVQLGGGKCYKHIPWSVVTLPPGDDGKRMREAYLASPLFEAVETDRVYSVSALPNDPELTNQWGPLKIQAPLAWDFTRSNDVIVAVIDTGIDLNHEDLKDNLWTGPDGEHGYTAIGGFLSAGGMDDNGHGTHVAGTIGGIGNNGIGVAGLNWKVQLIAMKFIGVDGSGFTADAALIIEKMIDLKLAGHPIRLSSSSWGGAFYDPVLEDSFRAAEEVDILNVCAAGNDALDVDLTPFSPASLPLDGIVSVLASDEQDEKALFSNWGIIGTDLFAPGVRILSCKMGGGYWYLSGTSMACPHVSGVLAAMFALNPSINSYQAKSVLLDPDSLDQVSFMENSTFGGRLNMFKAVTNPRLYDPGTNSKPTLTLSVTTNLILLQAGQSVAITATGFDADGDVLRYNVSASGRHSDRYLIQRQLGDAYTSLAFTNYYTTTNRSIGQDVASAVRFFVSDGRGATAGKIVSIVHLRDTNLVNPFIANPLEFSFTTNTQFADSYFVTATVNTSFVHGALMSFNTFEEGRGSGFWCCYPVNQPLRIFWDWPVPSTIRAHVMDNVGHFARSQRFDIDHQHTGRGAPTIRIKFNQTRGPTPLHVVADMSETEIGEAGKLLYAEYYWNRGGVSFRSDLPVREFTLRDVGLHAVEFRASRTNNLPDTFVQIFSVLPEGIGTNEPPQPPLPAVLTPPQNMAASLSGTTIRLTWSDTAQREDRYTLEHRTKNRGPWTAFRFLANANADATAFSFAAQRNTQYEFRLRACKDSTCGPYSNTASIRVR